MLRQRTVALSLVAVFVASMFTVASASAAGPFWHRNGSKLTQGSVGVTGQNKGNLSLSSKIGTTPITITCTASASVGTIDGQGPTLQGQGKGKVKYTGCKTNVANCGISETLPEKPPTGNITTGQLKIHLATGTVQGTEQIVALLEPSPSEQTAEKVFTKFAIVKEASACLLEGLYKVSGSVVAQLSPQEAESQEGSLFFPEPAITTITHEGQTVHPGLFLGTAEAVFKGYYAQKAQSGTLGVFRT
jgi:hypothetical protein